MQTVSITEQEYPELILSPSSTLCPLSSSPAFFSPEISALPRLQIDSLDTSPFSESFTDFIEEELERSLSDAKTNNLDTSYDIQCYTKSNGLDAKWGNEDVDVDEILVMRPKATSKLSTIEEETQRSSSAEFPRPSEFESISESGSGVRARLYRKRNNGQFYTIKTFHTHAKPSTERLVFDILERLKAPFLPQVYRSFHDADRFFVVMEYHSRENLEGFVYSQGPLNAEQVLFYASELILAISSLHDAGIIHRNLHPENVIISTTGHIILEGLESSELLCSAAKSGVQNTWPCTTPIHSFTPFSAPELLLNWAHEFSVDCWAFGMSLLFMLSGQHLFGDAQLATDAWKDVLVREPIGLTCIPDFTARNLVGKCLERNPAIRLSISGVRRHTYFSAVDWKKVETKCVRVPLRRDIPISPCNAPSIPSNLQLSEAASMPAVDCQHSQITSCSEEMRSSVIEPEPKRCPRVSLSTERSHILSRIFRTSSVLESSPKATRSGIAPDSHLQSTLTLQNPLSDNLGFISTVPDKMTAFWQALDLEDSTTPMDGSDNRPRKLRKSRSSFYPGQFSSNTSRFSLHHRLIKKHWFANISSPSIVALPSPTAEFPNGIKQIGSGIGFTYITPAAALSKASICTDLPQGCHGFFSQRLPDLRFSLRSSNALDKAKAKRTLLSLLVPDSGNATSPVGLGGSDQDRPLSSEVLNIEAEVLNTSFQSGLHNTESNLAEEKFRGVVPNAGFREDGAREAKAGDAETTLRLVTPSKDDVE